MARKSKEPEDAPAVDIDDGPELPSIAGHPRAARSIARTRSWAALIAFGIAAWLGYRTGLVFVDIVIRAVLIGVIASLVTWAAAGTIWKQLIYAELAAARKDAAAKQEALLEEIMNAEGIELA